MQIDKLWYFENFNDVNIFLPELIKIKYMHSDTGIFCRSSGKCTENILDSVQQILPKIKELIGDDTITIQNVQVRKYEVGDHLDWHIDFEELTFIPHLIYEGILTLANTSDPA